MRYIYREVHTVYVDFEITLHDDELAEKGISPYDDLEIAEYIKQNSQELQTDPTEWWISAQLQNYEQKVGTRPEGDDSEKSIKWIE